MPKQDGKLRDLIHKVSKTEGWTVDYVKGHWRITGPTGARMWAPSTTGDRRSWYQVRLKLRRLGWPE